MPRHGGACIKNVDIYLIMTFLVSLFLFFSIMKRKFKHWRWTILPISTKPANIRLSQQFTEQHETRWKSMSCLAIATIYDGVAPINGTPNNLILLLLPMTSQMLYDNWKRLKLFINKLHNLVLNRGDSSFECFNRATRNYGLDLQEQYI